MKKNFFIVLSMFITWQVSFSQFQAAIGDVNTQNSRGIRFTPSDNGFITAGTVSPGPLGVNDAQLVKSGASGGIVWAKAYGSAGYDYFNSVHEAKNAANNMAYVAAGYTNSFGAGSFDMYLVATDPSGNALFTRTYGGANYDRANCVKKIVDPAGSPGLILVGETSSYPYFGAGSDVYVVRTDLLGNPIKSAVIGTSGNDGGNWIEQTLDGGYIITGFTTFTCGLDVNPSNNIYVIKLNPNLSVAWSKIFAGPNNSEEIGFSIKENAANSSIIVTGITQGYGQQQESFLLSLTATGGFNWMKVYGGTGFEEAESILVTSDALGNPEYIVSGYSNSFNATGNFDVLVFKTRQNGNLLWTKTYGGPGSDFGYQIAAVTSTTPNGYAVTGTTLSYGPGGSDVNLIAINNTGNSGSICEKSPIQSQLSVSPCITSGAQFVFITQSNSFQFPARPLSYSIAYCNVPSKLSSSLLPGEQEGSLSFINLSPVPAHTSLDITLKEEVAGGTLKILNTQGETIRTEVIQTDKISLDLNQFIPGIYFVQMIRPDGTTETARFVKE